MTTLSQRLDALVAWGDYIRQWEASPQAADLLQLAENHNGWFSKANSRLALRALTEQWLNRSALTAWVARYPQLQDGTASLPPHRLGLVLAGNIPLVGFHDVLCGLLLGCSLQIKLSDKDRILLPHLLQALAQIAPALAEQWQIVERLKDFQAVIATGSDNSAVHFKAYFDRYPHIIRQNRNSVAVLDGQESDADWLELGKDIFRYFGLGCRSVSKLYVPQGYDFVPLLAFLDRYADIMQHNKYKNNYDYNRSLYLLNNVPHFANDCLMLIESPSPLSRIATLHYEFYSDQADLQARLADQADALQCIAQRKNTSLHLPEAVTFGQTQEPSLWDYADKVDTIAFLLNLA